MRKHCRRKALFAFLAAFLALCLGLLGLPWGPALPLCRAESAGLSFSEPDLAPEEDPQEAISAEELAKTDAEIASLSGDESLGVREKLDRIFKSYVTMGASVAVIENGEITFTHVYGLRQRDGAPVTEDTAFQVASIGKMVAGIALMQQVEQGKATLDSDLSDLFGFSVRNPQYPGTPITLRQLMSHTAGLRDSGYYSEALQGRGIALRRLFSGDKAQYSFLPDFQAGMDVRYSNFGGGMAGSLIEKLSGQNLDDYMARHVFGPLGVTAAYQPSLMPESIPLADMYEMPSRRLTKELRADKTHVTDCDPEAHYFLTGGKLTVSASGLAKILIALCDGGVYHDARILRESSVREMTARQNRRESVSCESNRGLFMNIITNDQVEGRTMYGHGGKANGMLCAAYFDPTDRTGVVMLTNGCNNRKVYNNVGMLGRAVLRICYDDLLAGNHVTEDPFLVE